MAKLPYTFTVCPPDEAPKQITASCAEIGRLLKTSINGDLTIDVRRNDMWGRGAVGPNIEDRLHALIKGKK
jgi:hypothetical protein